MKKLLTYLTLMTALLAFCSGLAQADATAVVETVVEEVEAAPAYADYASFAETAGFALFTANNIWMMLSAALVFIMHLGFATVESGLTRAKNTTNILFKNVMVVCIGMLTYAIAGFNLMYPGDGSQHSSPSPALVFRWGLMRRHRSPI